MRLLEGVQVARPSEVFVRRLRNSERGWLRSMRRRGGRFASAITFRRAQVIDMSRRRYTASEIAYALAGTPDWVRRVIHEFNDRGLESLYPAWGGGRPRRITTDVRARIVEVVKTRPQELGEPFASWSLSSLRAYLIASGIVAAISEEHLRRILHAEGYTTAATKTWKTSPDPDFAIKAARLKRLYRAAEAGTADGVVLCFDEHGPVTPTPKPGRTWSARGRPGRRRANYRKPHGVAFFFGVYDVGADYLFGRWFWRKGADHVMSILRLARRRYRGQRIYLIQDNLSSHWTKAVRALADDLDIVLVPTPTYASWLNRIECQFGAMVKAVFAGSDYPDHDAAQAAAAAWMRRRNQIARRDRELRVAARAARRRQAARRRLKTAA